MLPGKFPISKLLSSLEVGKKESNEQCHVISKNLIILVYISIRDLERARKWERDRESKMCFNMCWQ